MSVHANIEPLGWESGFFALSSAKLVWDELAAPVQAADLQPYALVQAKVPAARLDLADGLAHLGFQLAEGEVDLALSLPASLPAHALPSGWRCRVATETDIALLRSAAAQTFAHSRFRAPWYQASDSGRFYAEWIEKAIRGTFDHQCLLIEQDEQILGFVTLRDLGQQQARIGLLAAMPACAGRGVGQQLMWAAQNWCQTQGISTLRVATQTGNVAALRLYIRSGAVITDTAYWFYR